MNSQTTPADSPTPAPTPAPTREWLHEPLLHFVLVGALMFGAYAWLNRDAPRAGADSQIVLTNDDLLQMQLSWRAQGRPEPTPQQMQGMIETKVREEVLYREALLMGLDNDDVIVRRRLAQMLGQAPRFGQPFGRRPPVDRREAGVEGGWRTIFLALAEPGDFVLQDALAGHDRFQRPPPGAIAARSSLPSVL